MTTNSPGPSFAHLGLARWPFSLVPLEGDVKWYGREAVKDQVDRLLWRLSRVPNTSLHLIWADVGSGKTHTLRYMEQQISSTGSMKSAFALMPRGAKGFVDVYAAIARGIDFEQAARVLAGVGFDSKQARDLTESSPDLLEAARGYWMGLAPDRAMVREWFTGSKSVPIRDLRRLGITQPIRTFEAAAASLETITKVTLSAADRFVVMIDEAQRIGTVRAATTSEICSGLQGWYNAVPSGLSIVMAFSFGDESHLSAHLTPELLSREDSHRVSMPPMSSEEGAAFITAIVDDARLDNSPEVALEPATISEALAALVAQGVSLTPRNLIKGFDLILGEIDYTGSAVGGQDIGRLLAAVSFDAVEGD